MKNTSAVTASHVVVTDQPGPGLVVIAAGPSAGGSCVKTREYVCTFASITPHGEASVLVAAKDYGGGDGYNRAVVGSASPDGNGANNVDTASVGPPIRHFPACGSRVANCPRFLLNCHGGLG